MPIVFPHGILKHPFKFLVGQLVAKVRQRVLMLQEIRMQRLPARHDDVHIFARVHLEHIRPTVEEFVGKHDEAGGLVRS